MPICLGFDQKRLNLRGRRRDYFGFDAKPHGANEDGFAVISVLILGIAVSLVILALTNGARNVANTGSLFAAEVETRAALEGGLSRAILAYARRSDGLREQIYPDGRWAVWQIQGKSILLSAQAESGKLDVNSGDRVHLSTLAGRLLDHSLSREHFFEVIERTRRDRVRIASVAVLLAPADRVTKLLDDVKQHLTIFTHQTGFDPTTASDLVIETIPGIGDGGRQAIMEARARRRRVALAAMPAELVKRFSAERPIYSFRAQVANGFGRAAAMVATVEFSVRGTYTIYEWTPASVRETPASYR